MPARAHRSAFVDFQNDVTTKDLAVATAEGFVSIEHVKRYTTTGMATDQGKTSNLNALATVAALTGQGIEADWPDEFPPALHAGDLRCIRRRGAQAAVRADAAAADLDGRSGAGGCRHLEARPLLPAGG